MNRLFLLLLLLSCSFTARAVPFDNAPVTGRILDQDNKPLEFVVVTLLKAEDSTLVKGSVTDAEGKFSLENIAPGKFLLTASFTGFTKTWHGPFEVAGSSVAIPDIQLTPAKEMETVTIAAARPLFTQRPGKLIMNVENSPVRITGTAWDLISKAPGVVVDPNNNITLRGKSGVRVFVDGKPTYLAGDQLKNYLDQISAADVISVEIISNPSAKYDAEGSGGILNIITRKGSRMGFNGTVRAGYGQSLYPKYEAGLTMNYAREKTNFYFKYDFFNQKHFTKSYITRNVPYNGVTTNFNQHSNMVMDPLGHRARIGMDVYGKNNMTWGVRFDGGLSSSTFSTTNSTVISSDASDTTSTLNQVNYNKELFRNGGANIYLKQPLDTNGKEISASVDYILYDTESNADFDLNYSDNFGNVTAGPEYQRSKSVSGITILVGQVDYTHPFGKKYRVETGIKSSYVETDNDLAFDLLNNSSGNWENDTTRSNRFIYKEQINALYATGSADYGKWQVEIGLRAEQTVSDGNSPTTGQQLKRDYIKLFPSIFVLQKINDKHSLNYSYSRRINRPDYGNLNPFVFYLDKYTYEVGNPFLQPEIADNADITYSFMDAVFFSVSGSRTKYAMTDVTKQIDSTGSTFKTTENLNTVENLSFGLSSPVPVAKWLMMETEFNVVYNRFASELYGTMIDNRNWMFNGSANLTFMLKGGWKAQAWGWYRSPATYGIFRSKSMGGVGASLSKNFLENKLQLSLTVTDIFRTNGMRASINFQNQDVYMEWTPDSRRVYLRVRYSFGNTKAARRDAAKSGADELKQRTGN